MNLVAVGKKIKKLRKNANLTQGKVAEFLFLDQSMIAKMEKGERTISVVKNEAGSTYALA